jgi:hypothetical protein
MLGLVRVCPVGDIPFRPVNNVDKLAIHGPHPHRTKIEKMAASISSNEIRTLKRIALAEPSQNLPVEDVRRLKELAYVRDSGEGLRVTKEGMMWIVGGEDD